jgi:predicted lipoprotein with Yx(FWY)xxD motif
MKTTLKTLGSALITVLVTLSSFALAYHNVFSVFTHEQYGTFLTDKAGKTLYIFKADTQSSGESTCCDSCASAWPPYSVSEAPGEAHDEVTGELGTITRKDGSNV